MRSFLVVLLFGSGFLCAQPQRREIVNPSPNPADEQKSNNPQVPGACALSGQFTRVVILRFKFDTDLLAGLEKMVREQKIRNAVILSAAG